VSRRWSPATRPSDLRISTREEEAWDDGVSRTQSVFCAGSPVAVSFAALGLEFSVSGFSVRALALRALAAALPAGRRPDSDRLHRGATTA
jgi:hypothetical protein